MDYVAAGTQMEAPSSENFVPSVHGAGDSESDLSRRFSSGKTPLAQEPVVYEFTNDPALLHQYYRLRVQMYRKVLGANDFDEKEDAYDRISHILIARKGKLCIGGCRLTVCEAGENLRLPMESLDFQLEKILPHLNLPRRTYAEAGRFAVLEDHNSYQVLTMLSTLLMKKAASLDVDYAFARSEAAMARNWRKIVNNSDIFSAEMVKGIDVPTVIGHPEIKMYLNVFTLIRKAARQPQRVRILMSEVGNG